MSSSRAQYAPRRDVVVPNDPEVAELFAYMTNTTGGSRYGARAMAATEREVPAIVAQAARAYAREYASPGDQLFSPAVRAVVARQIINAKRAAKVNRAPKRRKPARAKRNCGTAKMNTAGKRASAYATKAQVLAAFRQNIAPRIPKGDAPAMRFAWRSYVDGLLREGSVGPRAEGWRLPVGRRASSGPWGSPSRSRRAR